MAMIRIGDTEFGCDEAGSGPVVVLVHAGCADRRMWDQRFPELFPGLGVPGREVSRGLFRGVPGAGGRVGSEGRRHFSESSRHIPGYPSAISPPRAAGRMGWRVDRSVRRGSADSSSVRNSGRRA